MSKEIIYSIELRVYKDANYYIQHPSEPVKIEWGEWESYKTPISKNIYKSTSSLLIDKVIRNQEIVNKQEAIKKQFRMIKNEI